MTGYQAVNRANWDDRVPAHVASPDYAVERYVTEPDLISDVVRFDLPLLGDITGLRVVHLQCHIGTGLAEHDTVPWNALPGAMEPVGERATSGSEWRLTERQSRLPRTFTLQAIKEG